MMWLLLSGCNDGPRYIYEDDDDDDDDDNGELTVPPDNPECTPADTIVATHGQLAVDREFMVNSCGERVQLKGVSSDWLNWEANGYAESKTAMAWMIDNWNIKIIRAAMGVEPNGAYLDAPDQSKAKVRRIVENAISLGIYVVIDWHSHSAHTGEQPQAAAAFFTEMAETYGHFPNVLYETYNEPEMVTWAQIKPYHESVVSAIRAADPDNIIILGTPVYSQNVDEAALDPVAGTNLMYTLHFYACDHGRDIQDRAWVAANDNYLPLFVSEWGATPADGGKANPIVCQDEADEWLDMVDMFNASWIAWKLDGCADSSCLLRAGAPTDGPWDDWTQGHAPYVISKLRE